MVNFQLVSWLRGPATNFIYSLQFKDLGQYQHRFRAGRHDRADAEGCRRPSHPCSPALSRTEAVVRAFAMMRMIDYRKALLMPLPDDRNILKFGPPKYPGEVEITPAMVESVRQRLKEAGGVLTVWAVLHEDVYADASCLCPSPG